MGIERGYREEHVSVPDAEDLPDNDELFAMYMMQKMYNVDYSTDAVADYGETRLTGASKELYHILKAKVKEIADGNTQSTKDMAISMTEGWLSEQEMTDGVSLVIDCLLIDCPQTLFWYDKSYENGSTLAFSYSYSPSTPYKVSKISMVVAGDYRSAGAADVYTPDSAKLRSIDTAIANAEKIVETNANRPDYEKLLAYKDEICRLVSYNTPASKDDYTGGYGDPWQLVNVFDHTADNEKAVVCEGYSKAFQYLCDLSEFEGDVTCYTVTGDMGGGHMWNIVHIDGKNYHVDVTNCDEGKAGNPDLLFMVTGTKGESEWDYSDGTKVTAYTYTFKTNAQGGSSRYMYDADMMSLYDDGILILADKNYEYIQPLPGTVTITGTAKYGEMLEAKYTPTGSETVTTYQWLRDGQEISNATAFNYKLTQGDIGTKISVRVSAEGYSDKTSDSVGPVEMAVAEIQVDETQQTVTVGGTVNLNATVTPTGAGNLHYDSKNEGKATVDQYGVVTGVATGTTQIEISLVSSMYEAVTKTVTVEVTDLPNQTVTFEDSSTAKTVAYGEANFTNTATATVSSGTAGAITYSSSNADVAAVDNNGEVTIAGVGTATITATAAKVEGQYAATSASYTLTVNPKTITPAVKVADGTYTYNDGAEITPNVTVSSDALVNGDTLTKDTDYTVTYSNNINAGTATVTVTAMAGSNYTWNPAATADFTINKKAGPAAPAVRGDYAVSTADPEKFVYTIDPIEGAEYSMDGTNYGDRNVFDNIEPLSKATFYARIKGTDNVEAGAAGNTGEVTFNKLNHAHPPVLEYAVSGEAGARTVTITPV